MTLYCNLHLVLSKTIRIDDIKYHIWCSVDIHGTIHSFLDIPSLSQHYYYCYNALHPCQLFLKFNRWGFYPFVSSFYFSFFAHGSHYPTKRDLLGVLCNCWKFIKIGYPLRGCLHHGPLSCPNVRWLFSMITLPWSNLWQKCKFERLWTLVSCKSNMDQEEWPCAKKIDMLDFCSICSEMAILGFSVFLPSPFFLCSILLITTMLPKKW